MQFKPVYFRMEQEKTRKKKNEADIFEREFKIFQINLDFETDSLRRKLS